jgi:hypothetical protein
MGGRLSLLRRPFGGSWRCRRVLSTQVTGLAHKDIPIMQGSACKTTGRRLMHEVTWNIQNISTFPANSKLEIDFIGCGRQWKAAFWPFGRFDGSVASSFQLSLLGKAFRSFS